MFLGCGTRPAASSGVCSGTCWGSARCSTAAPGSLALCCPASPSACYCVAAVGVWRGDVTRVAGHTPPHYSRTDGAPRSDRSALVAEPLSSAPDAVVRLYSSAYPGTVVGAAAPAGTSGCGGACAACGGCGGCERDARTVTEGDAPPLRPLRQTSASRSTRSTIRMNHPRLMRTEMVCSIVRLEPSDGPCGHLLPYDRSTLVGASYGADADDACRARTSARGYEVSSRLTVWGLAQ